MRFTNSLFSRLTWIFVFTALCLFIVAASTFRIAGHERPERQAMRSILNGLTGAFSLPAETEKVEVIRSIAGDFTVVSTNGTQWSSSAAEVPRLSCNDFENGSYQLVDKQLIVRNNALCFVFTEFARPLSRHGVNLLRVGVVGVLMVLGLSGFFIFRLFSPLKALNQGVRKIAQGDVTHRLGLQGNFEIRELAVNLDHMAGELQKMLRAKQELLLAVSHELRSPLTTAKILAEMVSDVNIKTRLAKSLKQLENLITSLLEAERLDQNHKALDLEEVDVQALMQSIISEEQQVLEPLKKTGQARPVQLDSFRFGLAVKNLINNALKYSSNQDVEVSLHFMTDRFEVHILDQGDGISEEMLARLGEAFYRPDGSRSRETGGFGLGVYLAQRVAKAHGGTLVYLPNPKHQGTKAVLQIPY